MDVCPECHGTGRVLVVSQDPATGEWNHFIEARCGECPVAKTSRHPGQSMYTAPLRAALADGPKTVAELAVIIGAKAGCFDYALEMGSFRRVDPSARTGPWMLAEDTETCPICQCQLHRSWIFDEHDNKAPSMSCIAFGGICGYSRLIEE